MQLEISSADRAFREEVREFFRRQYPRDILAKVARGERLAREDHVRSQQALYERGWLGITWPRSHGGTGWTPVQRYLFDQELENAGAPNLIPMAVLYIGPLIIEFGTPQQQRRWLPDILASRAMWAQGYSEPGAGSDLASLSFSAQLVGESYVLNGSKIWTTLAQWADWIFCLVRTSQGERKQQGITFLCVDMTSSGIEVDRIITMNGAWELNQVRFHNVRVPLANRIGEEGRGWEYANALLTNERVSYAHIARKRTDIEQMRRIAATVPGDGGRVLLDDPVFAARLARLSIEVDALELFVLRALDAGLNPGAVSILKIRCTECAQRVTELQLELVGRHAFAYPARATPDWATSLPVTDKYGPLWMDQYLFERAQTIYGGSTEVQKNIAWRSLAR